jgi:hypothetical protein
MVSRPSLALAVLVAACTEGTTAPDAPIDAPPTRMDVGLDAPGDEDAPMGEDAMLLDDAPTGADAGADAPTLADTGEPDGGPPSIVEVVSISFPLPSGAETRMCTVVEVAALGGIARQLDRLHAAIPNGGVLFVTRTSAPVSPVATCGTGSTLDDLIFVAQGPSTDLVLPPDVSIGMAAGDRLELMLHVANQTADALTGSASVEVSVLPESTPVRAPMTLVRAVDTTLRLPPRVVTTHVAFHAGAAGRRTFALSSLTHSLASRVTIHRAASASDTGGTLLYENLDWAMPPLASVTGAPFDGTDGLRIECTYSNPRDITVRFGGSFDDEECTLLTYEH